MKRGFVVGGIILLVLIAVIAVIFLNPFSQTAKIQNSQNEVQESSVSNIVLIQGFKFVPNSLTIKTGASVTWKNEDTASHSIVFSSGNAANSSLLASGEEYNYKFDTPGSYSYYCGPHNSMKGEIIVLE
jgi:plastocyanin